MQILSTLPDLSAQAERWRTEGQRIALVPTMGYFHEGHLALMRHARSLAHRVVVSRFINPTQFGPAEDLAAYPRDAGRDIALAGAEGVDALFQPAAEAMYAPDHATWVDVPALSSVLCGVSRPTHFRGVCTVVLKLFHLARPHVAVFGEKDWQQLAVIRRMARDLNVDVDIVGHPIVRESDGLAMSSRNAYLSAEERAQAPGIYRGLLAMAHRVRQGERDAAALLAGLREDLKRDVPSGEPDYLSIVHPDTLQNLTRLDDAALVAVAVRLGRARLIDNLRLLPL
ncbi:MAG: pantoate--beta-alanine ligase [Desulfovibrionaceae bacterium]|nr:pantoate--beta-alanine ligase [Desulfovibrionaceae bacterium]